MKNSKPALLLYIVSGILFLLSAIINSENLALISKPIVSSSMIFYYIHESKWKVSFWYMTILILLFTGGIFNLFEDSLALTYVIVINFCAYCILLGFIIKRLFEINFKSLDNVNLSYIVLMTLFLGCLLYMCLFLVFDPNSELYAYIIFYGLMLLIMGILISILYTLNHNQESYFLMMTILSFIICDLFYAVYYYYYDFILFRYLSIVCNILSFYFLVHYFLSNSTSRLKNEDNF